MYLKTGYACKYPRKQIADQAKKVTHARYIGAYMYFYAFKL